MSLQPGSVVIKDPDAENVYLWDWSDYLVGNAIITTSSFLVSTHAGDLAPLASDNESVPTGSTSTQQRLTGGTAGKTYTVTNRIITNETPAQTEDRSIKVMVRET